MAPDPPTRPTVAHRLARWLRSERGRQRLGAAAFWGLVAFVLAYNFPYFQALQHANEQPRIFQTMAMVEEGRYAIDSYRHLYGYRKTMDLSRALCLERRVAHAVRRVRPLPPELRYQRCRELHYSNKAPGMSFLAAPVYAGLRAYWKAQGKTPDVRRVRDKKERFRRLKVTTRWVRLGTATLPAFLFLLFLCYWLRPFVPETHPRRVAVLAYGLGTLAFTYATQVMSHQLATSLMFTAFMLVHGVGRRGWHPLWLGAAGLAGGAALASDYQLIFAAVPLALYTLWVVRPLPRVAWAVLGALPPVVLLLHYHHSAFGSVFYTGYDFLVARHDAALHDQGVLGITRPKWTAFYGSFLSQDNGLLYFSPWLVPALLGLGLLWRRRSDATPTPSRGRFSLPSAELVFTLAVCAVYVYFITSIAFWRGGWQTGPRYINAMLPALVLPYALLLRWALDRPWAWALAVGPALAAVFLYAVIVATFPHFPDKYRFPLFDLVLPLLDEGYVAYNLGHRFGLSGRASLVPYFAALSLLAVYLAAGPSLRRRVRPAHARRLLAGTLAVVVAIAVWGGYERWAEHGLKRALPQRVKGSRETYGHFLRRAGRDIRNLWEPRPPGVRARRVRRRRRPRRRHRRRGRRHRR